MNLPGPPTEDADQPAAAAKPPVSRRTLDEVWNDACAETARPGDETDNFSNYRWMRMIPKSCCPA